MKKVQATPEWKDYIEKSSQTQMFLTGDDFTDYMAEDIERVRKVAAEQGWLVGKLSGSADVLTARARGADGRDHRRVRRRGRRSSLDNGIGWSQPASSPAPFPS